MKFNLRNFNTKHFETSKINRFWSPEKFVKCNSWQWLSLTKNVKNSFKKFEKCAIIKRQFQELNENNKNNQIMQ